MKRRKEGQFIALEVVDGQEKILLNVSVNDIREKIDLLNDDADTVILNLILDSKQYGVKLKVKTLRQKIRQFDYVESIIPKNLSNYLVDLTQKMSRVNRNPIKGRDIEQEKIWAYISKPKRSNAILVGDIDVGKTTVICEIARKIVSKEAPAEFQNQRVILIDINKILLIENDFIYKRVIDNIFEFIYNSRKKAIFVIDNITNVKFEVQTIMLFSKMLTIRGIKLIGTVRTSDYIRYFETDDSTLKYLNEILVEEPEVKELYDIVTQKVINLKNRYKVNISKEMLQFVIYTSPLSESVSSNPGNTVNVLEWAFAEAKRKGKKEIDKECILSYYKTNLDLNSKIKPNEKLITAYHEVGHYILSKKSAIIRDMKVAFVSVLPSMDFLGVNWIYRIDGEQMTLSKNYYIEDIAIFLAGRIAEKLLTDEISSGARGDLEVANSIAEQMIIAYGLSEKEPNKNRSYTLSGYAIKNYLLTDKQKEGINDEIKAILNEANEKAEQVINENKEIIKIIAEALVKKEILTDEEIVQICKSHNITI